MACRRAAGSAAAAAAAASAAAACTSRFAGDASEPRGSWYLAAAAPRGEPSKGSERRPRLLFAAATLPPPPPLLQRPAPGACDDGAGGRFELVSKDKFLKGKLSASKEYHVAAGGMRFCDQKVGSGRVAERGFLVGVHFEGFRLNGRLLESSWHKGPNPLFIEAGCSPEFPALGEGVLGMKEGGRRELIVPPGMSREGVDEILTYTVDLFVVSSQKGDGALAAGRGPSVGHGEPAGEASGSRGGGVHS